MNNNTGKSKRIVRYKCPYCNIRDTRENLVDHVKDEHDDMIPKGYTAFRVVFDYVNKKPMGYNGKCTECGGPTGWDEDKGRYNRQCSKPACKASYLKKFEDNMIRTQGTTRISNTAEGQEKMLANRKISGTYKFSDGGEKTYTGSYERKALEFMDQVMEIKSDDILCPGPVLEYSYQGAKHMYITDFYYQPYNLIIEVKDGGNNPNKRNMPEYRAKQIAKEQYIIKHTNYNYIRLTDNNFQQLLSVFISLKFEMLENSGERVIHVNEEALLESLKEEVLTEAINRADPEGKWWRPSGKSLEELRAELSKYIRIDDDSILNESKDVSTLTDGFKTKSGKTFKLVNVDTDEALKYISKEWRESKNGKTLYVALSEQDDYEIAGYIGWNKSGSIAPLRVYEKFRGYGLSEILLKLAIKNGGYKLGVFSDNEVAIRLYKKFGFVEVDRKTYKDGDVVIMMELKNKISESTILTNYTFLDVQSNKNKVLKYLKSNSQTQKYADDIIDNYNGEIVIYNNTMIGRIFIGDKKDKGFITDLSVDKEHRGQKIGSRLIDDAISKYNGIDLVVDKDNSLAINMYKKRGFTVYKTIKDQYWMKLEKSITEGRVFNSDSIFYNKTKWDKGTINLCFVTGHSGSGKSTYAHNLEKRDGTVEVYELDDLLVNENFSDDNLKEYGDLIYSFFKKNPKFRIPNELAGKNRQEIRDYRAKNGYHDSNTFNEELVLSFIDYAKSYAKMHSKRYIIEGIQIFCFTEPELYKDYSIYIIGFSILKSWFRSAIRDFKSGENISQKFYWLKEKFKQFDSYFTYEKLLNKFRKYFKPLQDKIDKAEEEAFNELMTMVGYAPVKGIESSDAYIVNYMSNKVFTGEPSEAKIRDKIGVTNTRSLHTIIGLDDNQRLTKINKEDVHNPILYKIGKTNKEVSNILERCMESVVYKEYVYEALTGQKVYGDMSSQAEATLERVEILDEKKFKSVIESYLDSEGSVDEISRDLDNIEAKIEDLKKEGLA